MSSVQLELGFRSLQEVQAVVFQEAVGQGRSPLRHPALQLSGQVGGVQASWERRVGTQGPQAPRSRQGKAQRRQTLGKGRHRPEKEDVNRNGADVPDGVGVQDPEEGREVEQFQQGQSLQQQDHHHALPHVWEPPEVL